MIVKGLGKVYTREQYFTPGCADSDSFLHNELLLVFIKRMSILDERNECEKDTPDLLCAPFDRGWRPQ